MSRIRTDPEKQARERFAETIKIQIIRQNTTQRCIGGALDLQPSRVSVLLNSPDKLTVERLRILIGLLEIEPEDVLALVGYSKKDIQRFARQVAGSA